jgi:hypothetical protein
VADSKAVTVLPDISTSKGEWLGRYIQNVGANDCYYAIGHDCDQTNFNGILSKPASTNSDSFGSGQQFDASNTGQKISVFSRGGTTIAVTSIRRNDNAQGQGNILK